MDCVMFSIFPPKSAPIPLRLCRVHDTVCAGREIFHGKKIIFFIFALAKQEKIIDN